MISTKTLSLSSPNAAFVALYLSLLTVDDSSNSDTNLTTATSHVLSSSLSLLSLSLLVLVDDSNKKGRT